MYDKNKMHNRATNVDNGKSRNRNNKNNNKNNNNNYFDNNIQKSGINFARTLSPLDIDRDAERIFKDILFGNFKVEKHIEAFRNPTFLENLIDISYKQYTYCTHMLEAISMYRNSLITNPYGTTQVGPVLEQNLNRGLEVYNINRNFYSIMWNFLIQFKNTGDPNYLNNIHCMLAQDRNVYNLYKKHLNRM